MNRKFWSISIFAGTLLFSFGDDPHAGAAESPSLAQARINEMSDEELSRLARSAERFRELPADEQQRLRDLNSALANRADEAELRQVMAEYHKWFKELPPVEMAKLMELSPEQKLARIRELREEQLQAAKAQVLTEDDHHSLGRWVHEIARTRQDKIVAAAPAEQRPNLKGSPQKNWLLGGRLVIEMFHQLDAGKNPSLITDEDLSSLQDQLSPKASKALASANGLPAKIKLVKTWHSTRMRGGMARLGFRDERIKQFYDQLPEEERKRLLDGADGRQVEMEISRRYWDGRIQGFVQQLPESEQKRLAAIEDHDQRKSESIRLFWADQIEQAVQKLPESERDGINAIADEGQRNKARWHAYQENEKREGRGGYFGRPGFGRGRGDGPHDDDRRRGSFGDRGPGGPGDRGPGGRGSFDDGRRGPRPDGPPDDRGFNDRGSGNRGSGDKGPPNRGRVGPPSPPMDVGSRSEQSSGDQPRANSGTLDQHPSEGHLTSPANIQRPSSKSTADE